MQLSVILPTCLLKYCANPFYVAYATIMVQDSNYAAFFKSRISAGDRVFLDYSPEIPRHRPDLGLFKSVIETLEPSTIVLPGVEYDWQSTVFLANDLIKKLGYSGKYKWIGLVEGTDFSSLSKCYVAIHGLVDAIALPSSLEKIARREEIIRDLQIDKPVYYAEIFKDPNEERPPENVEGLWTSFPVRLALDHRTLDELLPSPPPLNFLIPKSELDVNLVRSIVQDYSEAL